MATDAMWLRTSLLRYYYTEMAKVHMKGGMFVKPMFFKYPLDNLAHRDYEHTFLVGEALKVSPVIDQDTSASQGRLLPGRHMGRAYRLFENPDQPQGRLLLPAQERSKRSYQRGLRTSLARQLRPHVVDDF